MKFEISKLPYRSLLILSTVVALQSCDGELALCDLTEEDMGMGDVFVETSSYFVNCIDRVDEALRNGDIQTTGMATIDNSTITLSNDTLTINFGNVNVPTADGKLRRGKLVALISGDYFTAGSVASLQMVDYHVDDVPITGNISISNNGTNSLGNWNQSLQSGNFMVDTLYAYNAGITLEWLAGYSTDSIGDDIYTLSGSISGDDFTTGASFSTVFLSPLKFDRTCQYKLTEGIVDLSITGGGEGLAAINVDFLSSDSCNNVMIISAACGESTATFPKTFDGF